MTLDLFDFNQNPIFIKMIHNKGISAAYSKTIITVSLLPLPFGFLINRCFQPTMIAHAFSKDYTVLLLVILAVNAYSFKRYTMPLINQHRNKRWENLTANIIEIGIFKVKFPFNLTKYFPALIYEYEVDQQKYQSHRLSFVSDYVHNQELDSLSSNQYHEMNARFSKWMEEKKLDIYYNPNNPKESVVFRDLHPTRKLFYLILGTLSTMALLVSIYNLLCYAYWIT